VTAQQHADGGEAKKGGCKKKSGQCFTGVAIQGPFLSKQASPVDQQSEYTYADKASDEFQNKHEPEVVTGHESR